MSVAQDLGLSVSMSKTKMMVTGRGVTEEDTAPVCMGVDEIECVSEFQYLGSLVTTTRRAKPDVDRRIARASLHRAVFGNRDLTVTTKRSVYQACVLSVLLNGSECWSPLKRDL